jgi:acyl-CoA thioester hydrolase
MRIELPADRKLVHEMVIPMRWGDMDAMGHVNNTLYFRYLEILRIDWFRAIGCVPGAGREGPLIVNAFCNFYRQLEFPADLRLRMYASDPGRSSFESWATIERADDPGVICADGGATTVWLDASGKKSAPLPDWLRQLVA